MELMVWNEGELRDTVAKNKPTALKVIAETSMFIAVRIDTNTAETFRHGIWYAKGDVKQRLDIVPLTLAQYQKYFVAMFQRKQARPEMFRDLILKCESQRDVLEAPVWKQYISDMVTEKIEDMASENCELK